MTEKGKKILLPNVGGHHYPGCADEENFSSSDCAYGCGCYMTGFSSGGPDGIAPGGDCPKSPSVETLEGAKAQQMEDNIIATIRELEPGKEGIVIIHNRGDHYQVSSLGIHPMDVPRVIEDALAIARDNIPSEHQEHEPN